MKMSEEERVRQQIVELDHQVKGLLKDIEIKKAWLLEQHASKVKRGGTFKLDDHLMLCAHSGVVVTTPTAELEEWLETQDDYVQGAFKHKGLSLNQAVYESMPIERQQIIDPHLKKVRRKPYIKIVNGKET